MTATAQNGFYGREPCLRQLRPWELPTGQRSGSMSANLVFRNAFFNDFMNSAFHSRIWFLDIGDWDILGHWDLKIEV